MDGKKHPLYPEDQTRLILAAALVATAIAAIQILSGIADGLIGLFITGVFAISATSGFLFILLTAAMLKSSRSSEVGNWPFTEKFRMGCYNYCVDAYGVQIGGIIMFGCAYIFGWTFESNIWDWRIGAGALLSLSLAGLTIYIVRFRKRQHL